MLASRGARVVLGARRRDRLEKLTKEVRGGGHTVHPTPAVYSATKFAVIAISEGLRQENDSLTRRY